MMSDQHVLTGNAVFIATQNVTQNVKRNVMKNDTKDLNTKSLEILIDLFDVSDMSNKSSELNL